MSSSAETLPAVASASKDVQVVPNISASIGSTYREWYGKVLPSARRSYWQLLIFSIVFLGGFGAWAVFAPIGGATVVTGRIVADGYNMRVNHQDGGIVSAILVREGDRVRAGDILAEIDSSEVRTNLDIQEVRQATAEIRLARYHAEEADKEAMDLSDDLLAQINAKPSLLAVFESQKGELSARLSEKLSTLEIYDQRIASSQTTLKDLDGVLTARRKRIADLQAEITVSDDLLQKGFTTRDRNYNMKRQLSVDEEQLETLTTQIAERRSELDQSKENRLRWLAQRKSETSGQIVALNAEKAEALERIRYLKGVIDRSTIRSPETGHIVRSYVNTIGSSIARGDPIFEILPEKTSPIVEAMVGSRDIDVIAIGEKLDVKVPSQDRNRSLMLLKGEVTYISYDTIPVGNPPHPLYVVRGKIDDESMKKYGGLKPGTNVNVFFLTEPKNFIHYILDPYIGIRDKAFTH